MQEQQPICARYLLPNSRAKENTNDRLESHDTRDATLMYRFILCRMTAQASSKGRVVSRAETLYETMSKLRNIWEHDATCIHLLLEAVHRPKMAVISAIATDI